MKLGTWSLFLGACVAIGCGSTADSGGESGTSDGSTDPSSSGSDSAEASTSGGSLPMTDSGGLTGDSTDTDASSSTGPAPTGTCVTNFAEFDVEGIWARDGVPIDSSCSDPPTPCGGDVVGTWSGAGGCGEPLPDPIFACPDLVWGPSFYAEEGTRTFEADGAFDFDLTLRFGAFVMVPPDCGGAASCADFAANFEAGSSCLDMGGMCDCELFVADLPIPQSGTYEVQGDDLVLTSGASTVTLPYCVAGERLSVFDQVLTFMPTQEPCSEDADCMDLFGDDALCRPN